MFLVWQNTIVNEHGDIQPGAFVEIKYQESGVNVQLYADSDGTTPLSNPVQADGDGFVRVYIRNEGRTLYRIRAFRNGFERIWENELIGVGEPRTALEITSGVVPVDFTYPFGDMRRYGAVLDGVNDDTSAVQTWINLGGGYLPQGGTARITSTLVVPNRTRVIGSNTSWSPDDASKMFRFSWDGAAGGVVIQVAQNPLGMPSTSARTGIHLAYFLIEGNDLAGIGLYGNYVSNESEIHHISVRGCNLFGILAGKLWYSKWYDLVARNCAGIGIAFGFNYNSTFDNADVNGVWLHDIRGASNGQRYNAVTAPTGFSLVSNPLGGCGVYLKLDASSSATNVLGENNYGAGVVIESASEGRSAVRGIYVEGNMTAALTDGETTSLYGLILASTAPSGSFTTISGLYAHQGSNAQKVYYYQTNTGHVFEFDRLHGIITFESNVTGPVGIIVRNTTGGFPSWVNIEPGGSVAGRSIQALAYGAGTATNVGGIVESVVSKQATNWASGAKLKVAEISLRPQGQARAVSASVLLHIGAHAWSGGNQSKFSGLYVINIVTGIRTSTTSTAESVATVTALDTNQSDLGATLLTMTTPSVEFSSAGDPATVTATITVEPTSTGAQANNSIVAAVTLLGGGLRSGSNPTLIPSLDPAA